MTIPIPTAADDYLSSMIAYTQSTTPSITDYQPGSIIRSLFEALALQLELVGNATADTIRAAIPEAAYQLWAFDRRAAVAANGTIRFAATATIAMPIAIPAGTLMRVAGTDRSYRTLTAATFAAGAAGTTLDVAIVATAAGAAGNVAASTIRELISPITGLAIHNPTALTNGRDVESDAERLVRFNSFIRSAHRGTAESIAYAAEQVTRADSNGLIIEAITHARVTDLSRGYAQCLVHTGSSSAPSGTIMGLVETAVAEVKSAGVSVDVVAATRSLLSVSVSVSLAPTHSLSAVTTPIRDAISAVIATLGIGDTLIREQMAAAILAVNGVRDVVIDSPSSNVIPNENTIIVLSGTPTVGVL